MPVVVGERGRVPVAQRQRREALPCGGEPAHLREFVAHATLRDVGENSARADRRELPRVPDQEQLRARRRAPAVNLGKIARAGHPGLVHDHQVIALEPPHLVSTRLGRVRCGLVEALLGGEPPRGVARGDAFLGEHLRRYLRRREPEHAAPTSRPRVGDRADREALAGPGRGRQHLHLRTGGQHAAHRDTVWEAAKLPKW